MLLLAVLTVVGLMLLTPVYAWEISTGKTVATTPAALAGIAYQGIFPAFLGYVFYAHAVKEIGGSKAGLFLYLTPVFGTVLSILFLNETPRVYHYVGIAMIFSGIYLTTARVSAAKCAPVAEAAKG
jgi:drug/metabolite transporter (DMT)-like permease